MQNDTIVQRKIKTEGEVFFLTVNFNIEKLNKLLHDFYRTTNLTVGIWDADMNQLTHQPKEHSDFCRIIKETPKGKEACDKCDLQLCEKCRDANSAVSHRCHAGLVDTAFPIKFEDEILGYIMFGQVIDSENPWTEEEKSKLKNELSLDAEALSLAYSRLHTYDIQSIEAASNILKAATRYLWLSDLIKINKNSTVTALDRYISENISRDISVGDICEHFSMSKNKLYSISKKHFGMTVGAYILKKRTDEAKHLLIASDKPIYEISALVGISDYNYFTKVFKKYAGVTPHRYRKNFNQ